MPYAIDKAVRRANRFALAQRLWREGCGAGEAGVRCRAGLFAAALRLRFADVQLSPGSVLRVTSLTDGARQHLTAAALTQWRQGSAWFNGPAVHVELLRAALSAAATSVG